MNLTALGIVFIVAGTITGCWSSYEKLNTACTPNPREKRGWETSTATKPVAVHGSDGNPVKGRAIEVTFDCRCHLCMVPFDHMRYHVERCYPPGQETSAGIEEGTATSFLGPNKQWLKLSCLWGELPLVSTYYFAASKACVKQDTSFDIEIQNARGKEKTMKVSFKCNEAKSEITQCFFSDQAPKAGIDVSASGLYGGDSNKRFKLVCSKLDEPAITDELVPEICHAAKKVAEVRVDSSKKAISVRFLCNEAKSEIAQCFPPNAKDSEEVPANNERPVVFKYLMSTFTIKCFPDKQPKLEAQK